MASIVPFKANPQPGRPLPAGHQSASVIIFPGIRYEKREATAEAKPAGGRPSAKH